MPNAFRFISTQERIVGGFSVALTTFDGVEFNRTVKFARSSLDNATPQQLLDMGIETYELSPQNVYVPPAPYTYEYAVLNPLQPWQFRSMLRLMEKWDAVQAVLAAIPEGIEKIVAEERFNTSRDFNRPDQKLIEISEAAGITSDILNEWWTHGVSLRKALEGDD